MGNLLSSCLQSSTAEDVATPTTDREASGDAGNEVAAAPNENDKAAKPDENEETFLRRISQAALVVGGKPFELVYRDARQTTIYYDAQEVLEEEDVEPLEYAPATVPEGRRARLSTIEDPKTLLKKKERRRSSIIVRMGLQAPEVKVALKGYPGDLTSEELDTCMNFRRQLKEHHDPAFREMVHAFEGTEEEAHALCRFLRARKFSVKDVFDMMGEAVKKWKSGRENDFFPNGSAAFGGCPLNVFLTQYPWVYTGSAKNGCSVGYFMAGRATVEGVETLTNLDNLKKYTWHSIIYIFKKQVAVAREKYPDSAVRCESINVFDLKGLSADQLNQRTFSVLKQMGDPAACFPELLNRMVIVNAPRFFSLSWRIMKTFLDERTVRKIEIFSDESKGRHRLLELIDKKELPSDFGGEAASIDAVIQQHGSQQQENSKSVALQTKLLSAGRFQAQPKCEIKLSGSEKVTITVYSRSAAGADFSVKKGKPIEVSPPSSGSSPAPYSKEIASNIVGPGKVEVVATPRPGSESSDYWLLVFELLRNS